MPSEFTIFYDLGGEKFAKNHPSWTVLAINKKLGTHAQRLL